MGGDRKFSGISLPNGPVKLRVKKGVLMNFSKMLGKVVGKVVSGTVVATVKASQTAETAYHKGADILAEAKQSYRDNVGYLRFSEKSAILKAFAEKAKTLLTANDLHDKIVEAKTSSKIYNINDIASLMFSGRKTAGLTADQLTQVRFEIQDELGKWDAAKIGLVSKEINALKLEALKAEWDNRLSAK
jgi:hypothetical protein